MLRENYIDNYKLITYKNNNENCETCKIDYLDHLLHSPHHLPNEFLSPKMILHHCG